MEKAELINAGLGPRKLSLLECGVSWEFHEEMMSVFPKLSEGGGYELLRTQPNNNRELCVIPPKCGHCPCTNYVIMFSSVLCNTSEKCMPVLLYNVCGLWLCGYS